VALEDVQYLAGHSDPRTTRLYDRWQKKVTRHIVVRISIWRGTLRGSWDYSIKIRKLISFNVKR
jgi:hypothetical protein